MKERDREEEKRRLKNRESGEREGRRKDKYSFRTKLREGRVAGN